MKVSVTQVLPSDFSRVDPDVLEHASERGTRVHRLCAAYLMGVWAPKPTADIKGYYDSFKRWADEYVESTLAVETELRDDVLGIIGHPDWIGRLRGHQGLSLADWKTPAGSNKLHAVQVAAYMHMAKVQWGFPLRLRKDGSRAIADPIRDPHKLWNVFIGMLNTYRYLKEE